MNNPDLMDRIAQMIADPGAFYPRNGYKESVAQWAARVVVKELADENNAATTVTIGDDVDRRLVQAALGALRVGLVAELRAAEAAGPVPDAVRDELARVDRMRREAKGQPETNIE